MGTDERLLEVLEDAHSIAFDGCHKIYVVLDEEQTEQMREYGYENIWLVLDPDEALEILRGWYEASCPLRFIQSVKSPGENGDFENLIKQCGEWS